MTRLISLVVVLSITLLLFIHVATVLTNQWPTMVNDSAILETN